MDLLWTFVLLWAYLSPGKICVQVCRYYERSDLESAIMTAVWPLTLLAVIVGALLEIAKESITSRHKRLR